MLKLIIDLLSLFSKKEKIEILGLFFMIVLGSCLEGLGIGAISPFIVLLSRPEAINSNQYLQWLYQYLSPQSLQQFMIWGIIMMIALYVVKNIYLVFLSWVTNRYIFSKYINFSNRLFKNYLCKPYIYHLRYNSAQLLRNLENIMTIVQGIMLNFLIVFTESTVVVIIFFILIAVDPVTTLGVACTLIILMALFYAFVRHKLKIYGEILQVSLAKIYQHINQGLGGIKETKILGKESYFADQHLKCVKDRIKTLNYKQVVSQFPRYYIETAMITIIMLLTLFLIKNGKDLSNILVTLTLLGLAAMRLMPSLSRIGSIMTEIRTYMPAFRETYDDLRSSTNVAEVETGKPFQFNRDIVLENVTYFYPDSSAPALDNISLSIKAKSTVGFVGHSGSGKTTLIDVLMGLLKPEKGLIKIDGTDINENLYGWRSNIGYVPQQIYLTDDTILKNVAFGLDESEIDEVEVWKALELAQLKDFVKNLPDGLGTVLGENGVRCSGGQRQRIGIARALYHKPTILVMDEATAALDNETEKAFVEAIGHLKGDRTIILIAHRISTVKNSDVIFLLNKGKLVSSGSFDDLIKNTDEFRKIAGHTTV